MKLREGSATGARVGLELRKTQISDTSDSALKETMHFELECVVIAGSQAIHAVATGSSLPFHQLVLSNPRFGVFYVPEDGGVIVHALCNLAQPKANILSHLDLPTG